MATNGNARRGMRRMKLVIGLLLAAQSSYAGAVEVSGIVTEVQDGDSVTLVNRQAT
jgi:hypothetical protein